MPVDELLAQGILNTKKFGETLQKTFAEERLVNCAVPFHEPIKRQKLVLFDNSLKKTTIKRNNVVKTIKINRNILGKLLVISTKRERAINFELALSALLRSP